ncbi:MAG: hypothetical protein JST08_01185 [Actinobacteria bacterium]|nr:hypothetical protein [Actinomycetota bacterium]
MGDCGKRRCIFCGDLADDREHLLPQWLQKVLPSDEPVVHFREEGTNELPQWERKPFREKAKFVCKACNHGWMSELENEAKPILTPAITREELPYEFSLVAQWIAARWAVKTVYVMQASLPLAPPIRPTLLMLNFKPPPQTTVWIGSHARAREDPISSCYVQKPLELNAGRGSASEPVDFGYLSFLAVGGISFLVVEHRFDSYVECVLGPENPFSDMFIKLWPRSRSILSWPPHAMADRAYLDILFDPDTLPLGFDPRFFPGRLHEEPYRNVF